MKTQAGVGYLHIISGQGQIDHHWLNPADAMTIDHHQTLTLTAGQKGIALYGSTFRPGYS